MKEKHKIDYMTQITVTDKDYNLDNLQYILGALGEQLSQTDGKAEITREGSRSVMRITVPDYYADIVKNSVYDCVSDVIAVNYKYEYFRKEINTYGLSAIEKELLYTSLISADLNEDKRYATAHLAGFDELAVDGMLNFRLKPLKTKWSGIVDCMPEFFQGNQLKDFITYLIEDKKKRVYVDGTHVYDSHYHRLERGNLMDKGMDEGHIIREILLSGCGEVEISGQLPSTDEHYLKEYFGDKIIWAGQNQFNH